ncbi:MAG: lytic transglycosylase domain-containing protein [Bdellovibrionales bacterium]
MTVCPKYNLLCLAIVAVFLHTQTATAQTPQQDTQQKTGEAKDAGFFNFNKTLDGIMKPQADETPTAVKPPKKPYKKPSQKQQQSETAALPKPPKKPATQKREKKKQNTKKASLNKEDLARYQLIFSLQESGEMEQADTEIIALKDPFLMGYIAQQRYLHPTAYTSTFEELKTWLDRYADHPGAKRIYDLAERKRPQGNNTPLNPPQTKIQISRRVEPTMVVAKRYASARNRSAEEAAQVRQLQKSVSSQIRSGNITNAVEHLQNSILLDDIENDILSARAAAAYLYRGHIDKAKTLAIKSAQRSGLHVPLASWVAGLIAWKAQDYTKAASFFETVGRSNYASGWTRSAGAYWAARSHMRRGDIKKVSIWLERAAKNPRTFYGLISTRALGEDFDFNWKMPTFTKDNHKILSADPRGKRAIALAKIGDITNAQAELLRLNPNQNENMLKAMLAFAGYARLPSVAMRLGVIPANENADQYYDAALYPLGPWKPAGGFTVNPSLVNAIMRQESRFNPEATSRSGAKGLMQLMPATAASVADTKDPDMEDPKLNLKLGQRYLQELLKTQSVDSNLMSLLIAYNAGPGNLAKWKRQWSNIDDPLLFIELIPSGETRSYVEHVLSNYWIYRMRAKEPTPTLDSVVAGAPVKLVQNSR